MRVAKMIEYKRVKSHVNISPRQKKSAKWTPYSTLDLGEPIEKKGRPFVQSFEVEYKLLIERVNSVVARRSCATGH
jgi:hypothetical protein